MIYPSVSAMRFFIEVSQYLCKSFPRAVLRLPAEGDEFFSARTITAVERILHIFASPLLTYDFEMSFRH